MGEEENRAMGMDKDGYIFLEQRSRDRRPMGLYFDKSSWLLFDWWCRFLWAFLNQGLTLGFLHDFALGYFANWGRNTSVSIWRKWKLRITQGRSSHADGQTSRGLSTSVNFDSEWLIDVWPSAWELLPWVFIFARWRWLVLTVRTPVLIPCANWVPFYSQFKI